MFLYYFVRVRGFSFIAVSNKALNNHEHTRNDTNKSESNY